MAVTEAEKTVPMDLKEMPAVSPKPLERQTSVASNSSDKPDIKTVSHVAAEMGRPIVDAEKQALVSTSLLKTSVHLPVENEKENQSK